MEYEQINLGIFDLVGVIMLVLTGTSFIYLLQVKNKSGSSRMLLWFFLCVILSSFATIITNIGTIWDWAFAPSQDALLILGGVFLVRFAYSYPSSDQPREARWVVTFFALLAIAALTYAVSFAIRYIHNLPGDLHENQIYYLLLPIALSLTVVIFFRRSIHWSAQTYHSGETEIKRIKPIFKSLFKPDNRSAFALRNFGVSLAISLVPVVALVEKTALPAVVASFIFNFGAVIAISALMLTYLNYAPEPVTISAKLVGITLVCILLILGLAGVWVYHTNPGIDEHSLVSTFIGLVLLSSLLIILIFPFFYRTALLDPLERLLKGVRLANEGDLNIQVTVQYEDEIGFLTHSFNRMVSSLNEANQALQDEAALLEKQVEERTAELRESNEQLINENVDRKQAQAQLDRQLHYEQALAGCSQSLLLIAEGESNQQEVLKMALEHLRAGAQASRAYVFRNFEDPDLGPCTSILAEVCAQDIDPHINNPTNQRFPWSGLPKEWFASLGAGRPHGGPVEQVLASSPELLAAFLSQRQPLLSVQTFPISVNGQWWGFVGFDDCKKARYWDEQEILMLRTASEMIGNTLQRWQAEEHLRETLSYLEERVQERTIGFARANAELRHEIHERQRFQDELEDRLEIESMLAKISARLLSPLDQETALQETMADLGQIMQSSWVAYIQMTSDSNQQVSEVIEWKGSVNFPLPISLGMNLNDTYTWLAQQLASKQSVYIDDLASLPDEAQAERELLMGREITSLMLSPLFIENRMAGVIVCGNPDLPTAKITENIQSVEVIAGMLGSMLHRHALINTLEEKVAERTRELSAFFDMAMLAGEAREIADIMQPALVKIMESSTSEAALIHLYDEDQRVMRIIAQRGFTKETLSQLQTIYLDETTMAWIIERSYDVWSSGTSKHPDAFELLKFQSDAHIPLRARGKIQGLLSCYRLSEIPFNPYQVFFLNAIGEQLGMAVENYRLRLKTEEVATVQERQRLARELHDAVSQSLYSLTLFARSARDACEVGDQVKLMDSLEQVETSSLVALKEMRLLLYQLRSLALEEGGLRQALESRFNLVERRLGIQASVHFDEDIKLNTRVEQELFRLVTEALNNTLKHAGASQISVSIRSENEQLVLEVQDNGRGFDPLQAYSGMGLHNMRQRASDLGGHIDISSPPGGGTRIRVEIPPLDIFAPEGSHG